MATAGKFSLSQLKDMPRGIWALGFVSLFMDVSSEMIHALLPIYFVTVLGTSTLTRSWMVDEHEMMTADAAHERAHCSKYASQQARQGSEHPTRAEPQRYRMPLFF